MPVVRSLWLRLLVDLAKIHTTSGLKESYRLVIDNIFLRDIFFL